MNKNAFKFKSRLTPVYTVSMFSLRAYIGVMVTFIDSNMATIQRLPKKFSSFSKFIVCLIPPFAVSQTRYKVLVMRLP